MNEIKSMAESAGFQILKPTHINIFCFPVLWFIAKVKTGRVKTDDTRFPGGVNRPFTKMLDVETSFVKRQTDSPTTCSTLLVALKDAD